MKVFVEYNEPIGPISGFGLGDGTPGGLIIEKRVFLIFFSCGASTAFFLFVARVSSVTPLAGPVAKKKGCDKKTPNWKNSLKNWTFGRIYLRK